MRPHGLMYYWTVNSKRWDSCLLSTSAILTALDSAIIVTIEPFLIGCLWLTCSDLDAQQPLTPWTIFSDCIPGIRRQLPDKQRASMNEWASRLWWYDRNNGFSFSIKARFVLNFTRILKHALTLCLNISRGITNVQMMAIRRRRG